MENNLSLLDRFNNWIKESVMIKLVSIGFLTLILLIPAAWIESLINERQSRADSVISEVSAKWAGPQTITGPVLRIPFRKVTHEKEWSNGVQITRVIETDHVAYFLPDQLDVNGTVDTQELHRGIFDVAVYDSRLKVKAAFNNVNFEKLKIADDEIQWSDASLVFGINDLRGIHEDLKITSDGTSYVSESAADIGVKIGYLPPSSQFEQEAYVGGTAGVVVPFDWTSKEDMKGDFDIDLQLKGSDRLYFIPAGKKTSVAISGNWPSPSFEGNRLPDTREVNETDFKSSWNVLSYNRPFSDQWIDQSQSLGGSEFGVRLLIPADQYQKSMRTAKYEILIILLAFTALFLVEITRKVRIHPFQYILVGVALSVYYTLLLSISEHFGYDVAYAVSSIATILLVAAYSSTFLKSRALVGLFSLMMSLFYVFIFVIIQAEDYSLLIGSIGLFVIIAVVMYFSRNIRWYREVATSQE